MFQRCLSLVERRGPNSILARCRPGTTIASRQSAYSFQNISAVRPFSASIFARNQESSAKSNSESSKSHRAPKEKSRRTATNGKTSLRRVAHEAERSRGGAKPEIGKPSKADRDADAKVVTAYCAAEQYSISAVSETLKSHDYSLDPFKTGLYPQVVHVKIPSAQSTPNKTTNGEDGDVFIFPSGTVVAWDVDEAVITDLISKTLLPAAEHSHLDRMETEDLEYVEDAESHTSGVVGDTIQLGTGRPASIESDQSASSMQQHQTDLALVKIAFSSGIAGSAKLAVLESGLENYFKSTRYIPTMLSKGSRLPFKFTRSFILRKTGELLNARAQLNLNSELTDSLPDMFWDSRHELGLEGYFDRVGKVLDVNVRSRVLNQKMDYAQEIVTVLREQLSEKHGLALEWLIIILIAIEVAFEILRLYKEKRERQDPDSLETLMRRYLEKEVLGHELNADDEK